MSSRSLAVALLLLVAARATLADEPLVHAELVFNGDGSMLAIGGREHVFLWDVEKKRKMTELADKFGGPTWRSSFSADGKWFAASKLWSLEGQSPKQAWPSSDTRHWRPPTALAADGHNCVATTSNLVFGFDPESASRLRQIRPIARGEEIDAVAAGPRGRFVAIAGTTPQQTSFFELWDLSGKEPRRTAELKGHLSGITSLEFSKDGERLLSGGWDETVWLWDVKTGKSISTFRGHKLTVNFTQFDNSGKRIHSGSLNGEVREWDAATGELLRKRRKPNSYSAITRDGKLVAWSSGDGKVRIEEFETGKLVHEIDLQTLAKPAEPGES